MRIGQSTDIHVLKEGRDLILGGVKIPFDKGTLGHSDGDALLHAIGEAVLGALGLGDLGHLYPDNDEKTEGISSMVILETINKLMVSNGYKIGNIDSLIIIEKPKMAPHLDAMKKNIASVFNCDEKIVNVKATTAEKLGPIGNGEAVCCQAVVLLEEK